MANPSTNPAPRFPRQITVNRQISKAELRKQHQAELARQKNEETARRLADSRSSVGGKATAVVAAAYNNVNDVPVQPTGEAMIQVDQKNESILVPVNEAMVPFHVSHVKNVTAHQEPSTRSSYIRIIFNLPEHDKNSVKIKEFCFRSKDPKHINDVVLQIKTLRKQVANKAEKATPVADLKLSEPSKSQPVIRLDGLLVRPVFGGRGGRKRTGSLTAHANGLRYSTSRADERVDVTFANVKHAFFQPSENEMITLLHFHLHDQITVGNKKTKDVQFYVEVVDAVQTIGGGSKRSAHDLDEIEEERRENEKRRKINMDFRSFVYKVKSSSGLEFEQPLRDLGFDGVPHKAMVFMVPTSNCLVQLIETPSTVITLDEIEIVNLERVGLGQKSFDMKIVFKDFKRDVMQINSIPFSFVDNVEEWLDAAGIKYYESRVNLNWRPILNTITDDPEKFIEDGGWEFLNAQASDSDSDDSDDSDQGYAPSESEPESESESEEDESVSEEDDDDDDDDEEEGKTWEELEREADPRGEEERKRKMMKVKPPPGSCKRPRFW